MPKFNIVFLKLIPEKVNNGGLTPIFNFSALGLVQLAKLPEANAARAALVARYFSRLDAMKEFLSVPFRHYDRGTPTYSKFRTALSMAMAEVP